jgi:hypothetical protein
MTVVSPSASACTFPSGVTFTLLLFGSKTAKRVMSRSVPSAKVARARVQPAQEDAVLRRTRREALAALVGHGAGGLHQDEALLRLDHIHAAAALLARQRLPVEVGVLPAQRKFETALAVAVAVAGAHVAARFRHDGHHLAAKRDRRIGRVTSRAKREAASGKETGAQEVHEGWEKPPSRAQFGAKS